MRHYFDSFPHFKRFLVGSFAVFAVSLSGCAEAETVAPPQPAKVLSSTATNWDIQKDGSHIKFTAQQEGETFTGEFSEFSGIIRFDPDTPETGIVDISIPLNSVDAGSTDRNSNLPAKVWFSTKAFPTARFTSDNISKQGAGYLAKGELTLKGATAAIGLPFTLKIDGDQALMTGSVDMDRTQWDVGAEPWDTDEWVSRNVNLDIQVTATRSK